MDIAGGELVVGGNYLGGSVRLGWKVGSFGRIVVRDGGKFFMTNDLFVGVSGIGEMVQQPGTEVVADLIANKSSRRVELGSASSAVGTYVMSGGVFRAVGVVQYIGKAGDGYFYQYGGTNVAHALTIAYKQPSTGSYVIADGLLVVSNNTEVGSAGSPAGHGTLDVGSNAVVTCFGTLDVGHADGQGVCILRGGTIHAYGGTFYSVQIQGAEPNTTPPESGTLRGWGTFDVTNNFFMDGYCIADGFGEEHTLYITNFAQLRDNLIVSATESNGWYAVNGGRLVLRPFDVPSGDSSVYWADETLFNAYGADAVNSVEIQFEGVSSPGTIDGSLYSTNRSDVPVYDEENSKFAGIWRFVTNGFTFASANLVIRYDQNAAAELGIAENALKVYAHAGNESAVWTQITDYAVNTTDRRIIASNLTDLAFFAVGDGIQSPPPPPGTMIWMR